VCVLCLKGENKNLKFKFEEIRDELLKMCAQLGRIPKRKEINNSPNLPECTAVNRYFKNNTNLSYNDFCEQYGYYNSKKQLITIKQLESSWENFYKKYERFPKTKDFPNLEFNIPSFSTIMKILGNKKEEFFNQFKKIEEQDFQNYYNDICEKLKQYCINNKHVLGWRELTKHGFPPANWLVRNHPIGIGSYVELLILLGLKPNYKITKEVAVRLIMNKADKLNKPLMYDDFRNPNGYDEIGIGIINRFWGTFNNMLKELNLPINQEDMISKHKTLKELKHDINKLCNYIHNTKAIKNISYDDIRNCKWCLNPQTYNKYFREELGITLGEYIKSIGFIPNESGMGMSFLFDDGEITTSQYEYETSKYFRESDISYKRNIKYSTFINNYEGNKDCDYLVNIGSKVWYIEIAGMLDYDKVNKNKLKGYHKQYKTNLEEKEDMLKSNKLNYKILYPHDFKALEISDVFFFFTTIKRI